MGQKQQRNFSVGGGGGGMGGWGGGGVERHGAQCRTWYFPEGVNVTELLSL